MNGLMRTATVTRCSPVPVVLETDFPGEGGVCVSLAKRAVIDHGVPLLRLLLWSGDGSESVFPPKEVLTVGNLRGWGAKEEEDVVVVRVVLWLLPLPLPTLPPELDKGLFDLLADR